MFMIFQPFVDGWTIQFKGKKIYLKQITGLLFPNCYWLFLYKTPNKQWSTFELQSYSKMLLCDCLLNWNSKCIWGENELLILTDSSSIFNGNHLFSWVFFYFKLVYSGMFNPYESPSSKPAVSEDAAAEVSYKIKHKKRDDYHIDNVISRLR